MTEKEALTMVIEKLDKKAEMYLKKYQAMRNEWEKKNPDLDYWSEYRDEEIRLIDRYRQSYVDIKHTRSCLIAELSVFKD